MMDDDYKPFVPPTLLEEQGEESQGIFGHTFNNVSLKSGAILAMYEVDDDKNITKLGPEYDVVVIEQRQDQGQASTIYKNCLATDAFGSIADFLEFRRRVPEKAKEYKQSLDPDEMNGAFVLLLCLDGQSEKGIILGGLRNPQRKEVLNKESGQHLEFEFNGVNITIDKEGTFKLEYKSSSNNKGEYSDEEAGGSYFAIKKDGTVEIKDGNKEAIVIDKTGKKIDLTAEADISNTTDANFNVTAKKSVNVTATMDLIAKAEGKAAITAGSTINVKAESEVKIVSPIMKVSADSMVQIQSNQIDIKGQIVNLGQGGPPALTLQTLFLGTGNLGAPVLSQAIGPFSANVFFG